MAGKKKKSLANKLARMSDEERARYLQHKAEMEEEARRRKEQLISTFMKKKIKKEEIFSRLNLAKINQNWHQIMRKIKIKEMKEEVEHLRKFIEKALEDKNRKIDNLMTELEEAEHQYSNNFNTHSTHLDRMIDNQKDSIDQLQSLYQEEVDDLLYQTRKERNNISEHAASEGSYLRCVTYGQESKAAKQLKENWEEYSKRLYEEEHHNSLALANLRKVRHETESALWKQIYEIVRLYVQRTDVRRSHLQELRRIDAESAEEIRGNEERIMGEEDTFKTLTIHYENLVKQRSDKVKSLEAEESILKTKFLEIRKTLKCHLELDERQVRWLTATSNEVISHLEQLSESGRHLVTLSRACQKFETEREMVMKWVPRAVMASVEQGIVEEEVIIEGGVTDDEKLLQKTLEEKSSFDEGYVQEGKLAPIEKVKIEAKKSKDIRRNFLEQCYQDLEKMENFWMVYNKAEVDIIELKQERKALENENMQLKGMIRAVLEAAAMSKTVPNSSVSTRTQSRRRTAYSAPLPKITL